MRDAPHPTLRFCHRAALAGIAACALASVLAPGSEADVAPDPRTTTGAVGLALASIVARRVSTSPVIPSRAAFALLLCAWGFALALAALGVFVAHSEGQRQIGLVFAFAAAIFSLRPPAPVARRA